MDARWCATVPEGKSSENHNWIHMQLFPSSSFRIHNPFYTSFRIHNPLYNVRASSQAQKKLFFAILAFRVRLKYGLMNASISHCPLTSLTTPNCKSHTHTHTHIYTQTEIISSIIKMEHLFTTVPILAPLLFR